MFSVIVAYIKFINDLLSNSYILLLVSTIGTYIFLIVGYLESKIFFCENFNCSR